ncbi:SpaA isopeptide-forming pilin-related protein [Peptoniphilus porci]|uniref:SpaA-like prealbumin fold domain-containing protein n=1 Tax=Peptoniphilus porci TaxID=2652280 RepID=A0A1U7LX46_9FIRM|nr:SpaA isopeptide-forming pilin-related protein [Peptoniphilus porci]OLR61612.1 hypothetical protein BIV18_09665 [Peptoniphilus porci]
MLNDFKSKTKKTVSLAAAMVLSLTSILAPLGVNAGSTPYPDTGKPYTITIQNKMKSDGSVDHILKGATYKFEKIASKNADGSLTDLPQAELVDTKTIGNENSIQFTAQTPGKYKVTQTERSPGYLLGQGFKENGDVADSTIADFPLMKDGKISANQNLNVIPKLTKIEKPVTLTKLGEDKIAVDGTEFKFNSTELNVNAQTTDKITDRVVTVQNGKIDLGKLVEGKYTLQETKAVKGYALNNRMISFEITGDKTAKSLDEIKVVYDTASNKDLTKDGKFQNFLKPGGNPEEPGKLFDKKVKIEGTDAYSKDVHANVGQTVEYMATFNIPTDIKDYVKYEIKDVIDSRLDIVESSIAYQVDGQATTAMTSNYDSATKTINASITNPATFEGKVVTLTFKAVVNKTAVNKDVIPNDITVNFDNGKGETGIPNIPEKEQPKVTVDEGSLTINKIDGETKVALQGAEFKLQVEKKGKFVDFTNPSGGATTGTTNAQGTLVFERLPLGTYKIVETKAPKTADAEYKLNKEDIQVTLTGVKASVTQEVKNFKTTTWTPATGTLGTLPYIAAVVGLGLVGTFMYKKSKESK